MTDVILARRIESYEPIRQISEDDLRAAYGRPEVARRCACGGMVVADPRDPMAGVAEHQGDARHVAWRAWVES